MLTVSNTCRIFKLVSPSRLDVSMYDMPCGSLKQTECSILSANMTNKIKHVFHLICHNNLIPTLHKKNVRNVNGNVLPKPCGPTRQRWSPFPQLSTRHQLMLVNHGYRASASCGVPIYAPAFASTKLYCLVSEAHRCEQLAQSCYSTAWRPGLEPKTTDSLAQCPSH